MKSIILNNTFFCYNEYGDDMETINDYKECLTNLACSIRKYFDLDYKHSTLEYIDKILEENKPDNVVLILLDGMGANLLDRALTPDSFFIKNKYKNIKSVFPATTTAATTSIRTGLNPCEHGWLAWNSYIKPLDKIITMFLGTIKEDESKVVEEYLEIKKNELKYETIAEGINKKGLDKGYEIMPFGPEGYKGLDDMLSRVETLTSQEGKKFIYAYNDEPDHTMHMCGTDSVEAIKLIQERNDKVEKLAQKLENTLLIVIADHGHRNIENIYLKDYPTIKNMLERLTSNEPRSCMFKVKEEYLDKFPEEFNKYFKDDFKLYTKQEIIDSKLYGDGEVNPLFYDALGDFIAIASDSKKAILDEGDMALVSTHAGLHDDEVYVPIIVVNK